MKRGEVVIVDWPLFRPSGSGKAKARPALVVQNDMDNARLTNTILAMITSVTRRALEPT
jgi:mRNA-degrading endonuclease toxin of MazEF toxin-antitoxin module